MRLGTIVSLIALLMAAPAHAAQTALHVDKGDVAWMLVSTLLVLMMIVPGLALFYGGLVRAKNMLSIFSQVIGITALTILVWVGWGYSLAFAPGGAFLGGLGRAWLADAAGALTPTLSSGNGLPELVYAAFQMTFAAITAALIVGAVAERAKFSAMMAFSVLWLTIVYAPIAHMVWAPGGLIAAMGAIDFAGGTVVHINAGIAGLIGALFFGHRIGFLKEATPPHSLTLSVVGAGLLWVGWFGFNAGSALEASELAAIAMMNTFVAPAAGLLTWMLVERVISQRPSLLGGASGLVAGLVGITPAAGVAGPLGAILIGAATSLACYGFVAVLKNRLRLDDTLDVFGIHGLGGIVGSIGTALVASPLLGGHGAAGYDVGHQVVVQITAVAIAIGWSAVGSTLCFFVIDRTVGLRHGAEAERQGLDISDHGERAYNL